jgi:inner membrane protein
MPRYEQLCRTVASAFSHAAVAVAIGTAFTPPIRKTPAVSSPAATPIWRREIPRWWLLGVVCAVLPDIDVLSFSFHIGYGAFLGHRGFTHSILFAAMVAWALATLAFPRDEWDAQPATVWSYFFLCGLSHGVLDAMTNGGLGIAFFSPLDPTRYFLPWRPIEVSPIGVASFFTSEGLAVIRSELQWVMLPAVVFVVMVRLITRRPRPRALGA